MKSRNALSCPALNPSRSKSRSFRFSLRVHLCLLPGMNGILVIDTSAKEQSPATIRKHLDLLRSRLNIDVIFVRARMTAYNRKRLIENKVPFIVPGNQMYLPMLAIDLREHFRRLRAETPVFSPSTQAVLMYALVRGFGEAFIPSMMARRLGYSAMTMTRAFDELEDAGLGDVVSRGRERCLRFPGGREDLWARAQPFLRNPVTRRQFVGRAAGKTPLIHAGLSALTRYSMLSPPACVTYALSREEWKSLRGPCKVVELPVDDPDAAEIEVWSYPPALFADGDTVDRLSLYLSLKDDPDERTRASLEEMMRKYEW